jgi:hypothetical protein
MIAWIAFVCGVVGAISGPVLNEPSLAIPMYGIAILALAADRMITK